MTKRKTALARYIEYLEGIKERDKIPEYVITTGKNYLNTEKQDLIDAFDEGSNATSWDSFEEAYDITPSKEEYFNQTFENETI